MRKRIGRLEARVRPPEQGPQLVSEDTRRAVDAIIAARLEGALRPDEPINAAWLTDFLIRRGVSSEAAPGYVAYLARGRPGGGTDG